MEPVFLVSYVLLLGCILGFKFEAHKSRMKIERQKKPIQDCIDKEKVALDAASKEVNKIAFRLNTVLNVIEEKKVRRDELEGELNSAILRKRELQLKIKCAESQINKIEESAKNPLRMP